MATKWRCDAKKDKVILLGMEAVAEDVVARDGCYDLVIYHVQSSGERGFVPSLRGGLRDRYGPTVRGEDEAAYEKAKEEGRTLLREAIEALENNRPLDRLYMFEMRT